MLNIAKNDPSLNQRRKTKAKRELQANAKKAQRAIVRDGNDGYVANTPATQMVGDPVDVVLDLELRINALELTVSKLVRTIESLINGNHARNHPMVAKGEASPFAGDVVPMRTNPAVADKAEPSGPAVPGNEAEVLDLGEGQQFLPASPPLAPVTDIRTKKLVHQSPAANDATPDVALDKRLYRIVHDRYGFDRYDLFKLAKREAARRDKSSLRYHGMTWKDVQLMRQIRKARAMGTYADRDVYIPVRETASAYAQFIRKCESTDWAQVKARRLQRADQPKVSRQRAEARRKDEMRSSNTIVGVKHRVESSAKFAVMSRIAEATKPKRPPFMASLRSKWDATKMGWRDSIDKWNHRLGLTVYPINWFGAERALYERDVDPNMAARLEREATIRRKQRRLGCDVSQMDTLRIYIPGKGWPGLEALPPLSQMARISHEVMKRGVHTPLEMTIAARQIGQHFEADGLKTVAVTE